MLRVMTPVENSCIIQCTTTSVNILTSIWYCHPLDFDLHNNDPVAANAVVALLENFHDSAPLISELTLEDNLFAGVVLSSSAAVSVAIGCRHAPGTPCHSRR